MDWLAVRYFRRQVLPMVEWECPTKPREASGLDSEAVHEAKEEHSVNMSYLPLVLITFILNRARRSDLPLCAQLIRFSII